jgi:flavin-dependent dehydrogenase
MLVHWAMPIFEKLVPRAILENLSEAICNPHLDFNSEVESLPCYNGVTGDLLFSSPTPGARRVSRRLLRKLLAQGVDIKWDKAVRELSQADSGVRVEFEDGGFFDANYVLGADGSSSKVRELLLGIEKARSQGSGFLFATGITKLNDAEKTKAIVQVHPVAALMMGRSSVGAVGGMLLDPR